MSSKYAMRERCKMHFFLCNLWVFSLSIFLCSVRGKLVTSIYSYHDLPRALYRVSLDPRSNYGH